MSEMIERVAKAIYVCQFGTNLAGEFSQVDAEICARAALREISVIFGEALNSSLNYAAEEIEEELKVP